MSGGVRTPTIASSSSTNSTLPSSGYAATPALARDTMRRSRSLCAAPRLPKTDYFVDCTVAPDELFVVCVWSARRGRQPKL